MSKATPKRKAANGYKLAEPLPKGEILEDVGKKKWKLGPSIGQGGFGEIYSAQEGDSTGTKYPYVIKIEPHTNGPLFVEMHFYMRNAKPADVEEFKREKGLKTFGMPLYLGSGSHEYKKEKYRFVVMEKFGTDLWKIFLDNSRSFPIDTVFKVAIQILDVLEYIHRRGYVHADIKGANILMGITKETANRQVYLVDFGLATKFTTEKEFKPNPKKAHDGTIEYLSRDAHKGVQTRRGDLEILAYNLIQWVGCTLPWEKNLKDPNIVQKSKEEYMESVPKMIKSCFGHRSPEGAIVDYLNYLQSLKFNTEPDYRKIRKIFISGVKDAGGTVDTPLNFSLKKTPKRKSEQKQLGASPKRKAVKGKNIVKPIEYEKENIDDKDLSIRHLRSSIVSSQDSDIDDEDIIDQSYEEDPKLKKKYRNLKDNDKELTPTKRRGRSGKNKNMASNDKMVNGVKTVKEPQKTINKDTDEEVNAAVDPYEGYTDAMREVMMKKLQTKKSKKTVAQKKQKQPLDNEEDSMEGYTDTMKELLLKKKERLANKRPLRGKKNS